MSSKITDHRAGIWYATIAYIGWGILPIYWKSVEQVPALQLLAHRIFWSFLFVALLLTINKQWIQVKQQFTSWKIILSILGSSIIITVNWFIYIWAVNNDHVIETSLGYYINPLINVALGMLIFRERLDKWQWIAFLFAIIGVAIQTIVFGQIPWIALSLALTFAIYGLFKKLLQVEALISLALETMIVAPFAIGYLLFVETSGTGSIGHIPLSVFILLICSGVITFLPPLWFAQAARRVSLSTLGFLQYFEPTIALLLGVFFFYEKFTMTDLISFGFIWLALLIYTISRMDFRLKIQKVNSIDKSE
jgi:chloramphenicol-sensitive protein RarD